MLDPFDYDDAQHAGKVQIPLNDLANSRTEYSGEGYGLLSVYYPVAGMVPPEALSKK